MPTSSLPRSSFSGLLHNLSQRIKPTPAVLKAVHMRDYDRVKELLESGVSDDRGYAGPANPYPYENGFERAVDNVVDSFCNVIHFEKQEESMKMLKMMVEHGCRAERSALIRVSESLSRYRNAADRREILLLLDSTGADWNQPNLHRNGSILEDIQKHAPEVISELRGGPAFLEQQGVAASTLPSPLPRDQGPPVLAKEEAKHPRPAGMRRSS